MATFKWGHPIRPQETTIAQVLEGGRLPHRALRQVAPRLGAEGRRGPRPASAGSTSGCRRPNFFDLDPVLSDRGKATAFKGDSSDVTADLAVKFIRDCAAKKQPFLAVVWFGSPHAPHQALPEDRKPYADRPAAEQNFLRRDHRDGPRVRPGPQAS